MFKLSALTTKQKEYLDRINPKNYIYSEYQIVNLTDEKEENRYSKWIPCVLKKDKFSSDLPSMGMLQKNISNQKKSCFFSQYLFPERITNNFNAEKAKVLPKYSDFIIEKDYEEEIDFNTENYMNDMRKLYNYLITELDIPKESIRLSCSGGRSIHVIIAAGNFGYSPRADLPELQKKIIEIIERKINIKVDKNIYSSRRMFRVLNCFRPEKGTYKIYITEDEFLNKSLEELIELSKQGEREYPALFNPSHHSHNAFSLLLQAEKELEENQKKNEKVIEEKIKELDKLNINFASNLNGKIPSCITHLMKYGSVENKRHYSEFFHITYCKSMGYTEDKTFLEVWSWLQNITHKLSLSERERDLRAQIKHIYNNNNYYFGCFKYIQQKDLYLPCSNCPIIKKYKKRLIEIPLQEKKEYQEISIENGRKEIESIIENTILEAETLPYYEKPKNICIKINAGAGKSTIAIKKMIELHRQNPERRFIYCHPTKEHLEDLHSKGELPDDSITFIRSKEQIEELLTGETKGNCYYAYEFSEGLERRKDPELLNREICSPCEHRKTCKYKEQRNNKKCWVMTHAMFLHTGSSGQKFDYVIIDEDITPVMSERVEPKKYHIENACDAFQNYLKEYCLFTALLKLYEEAERKTDKYVSISTLEMGKYILSGSNFLKELGNLYREVYKENFVLKLDDDKINLFEDLKNTFFTVNIEEDSYHWRYDFYKILLQEIELWNKYGDSYNSTIYLEHYLKHGNTDFTFHLKKQLTKDIPAIILDATASQEVYQTIYPNIEIIERKLKRPDNMKVTVIYDTKLSKRDLLNPTIQEKIKKVNDYFYNDEKTLLLGWKGTTDRYFYNLRGINKHENCERVIVLGTPNKNITEQKKIARLLWKEKDPVSFERKEEYIPYNCNINSKNFAIKQKTAIDNRFKELCETSCEAEIMQGVCRVRPYNKEISEIVIFSKPIAGLEPDRLITFDEYLKELDLKKELKINLLPAPATPASMDNKESETGVLNSVENLIYNQIEQDLKRVIWSFSKFDYIYRELEKKYYEKWRDNSLHTEFTSAIREKDSLYLFYLYIIALVNSEQTRVMTNGTSDQLSKDQMYFKYKKFIKKLKFKEQKIILKFGKKITFHFSPIYSSEILSVEVLKAEYEKFNKYKEKGQVLKLMFSINTVEQEEQYTEEEINLAASIAEDILNNEPVFTLKTSRSTFLTSPHIPCLLNCDKCRNLNTCAAAYEEDIRSEFELCLT